MPMKFEEYQGWVNYPTWLTYNALTSYDVTRVVIEKEASLRHLSFAIGAVSKRVGEMLNVWEKWPFPPRHAEAIQVNVHGLLRDVIYSIDWFAVIAQLQGTPTEELDPYEWAILRCISDSPEYQNLMEADGARDSLLRDYLENQMVLWCTTPDVRKHHESPISICMETLLDKVWKEIHWDTVTKSLRGE